jgi:hypothetical protein
MAAPVLAYAGLAKNEIIPKPDLSHVMADCFSGQSLLCVATKMSTVFATTHLKATRFATILKNDASKPGLPRAVTMHPPRQ